SSAGRANAESFRENMAGSGRIILEAKQHDLVTAMRDSVLAHPTAQAYLTSDGKSEQSIFWEKDGISLKCRPDRMPNIETFGHVLVDLKKVGDIDHLERSIQQFRYHVQAAFYSDAYHQLMGSYPRFIFIAVGERRSIGRHPVRVFELPVDWVDDGREEYLSDLEAVKELNEFGSGLDVEVMRRPKWTRG
ncbi:MAG: PD-(D/E)XK nuclease-like domain-containing protein, partial [Sphingobacterium sp.]